MQLRSFMSLVEIRTKLASMVPFLLGTFYALYHFQKFNISNFIILFISLTAFDMVTTALNNYYDYKRAIKKHGYNYETHNAIVQSGLRESRVIVVILVLFLVAVLFGILLVLNTNVLVLLVGMVSFGVGIIYSFGPVPISRTPLGELLSGLFMGFVIVLLSVYVHVYDQGILQILYLHSTLTINVDIVEIVYIFLLAVPAITGISNIMLANNICDMEDDIENRRYTLPIYIGKQRALMLFKSLYYIAYIDMVLMVLMNVTPIISLFALITFVPVNRNIRIFHKIQIKKDTFALSVKNFMLMAGVQAFLLAAAVFLTKVDI